MEDDIRILLVDDERLVLRSMEKTLLRAGFDVETASDAQSGLEQFKSAIEEGEPFDVAVLDLNMPNLAGQEDPQAGLQLLSKILEIRADLPVIVLSAFDQVALAKDAVERGARAYLVKGREAGLLEIIDSIIEQD
jgi:two-component system nitrogen regulation response regulator GlnG